MVAVSVSLRAPPEPVLPPSLLVMVSVTLPLALAAGVNTGWLAPAASQALMLATVPVSVSVPVPEPVTVTPPDEVPARVPEATPSVTETGLAAASISAMARPARATLVSSLVVNDTGKVLTGASLTALMLMARVSTSVRVPPEPVLPLSEVVMVSVTGPLAWATGV